MIERQFDPLLCIVKNQIFRSGSGEPLTDPETALQVLKESRLQTVFSIVFPALKKLLLREQPEKYLKYNELFMNELISNANNLSEHNELHRLMEQNDIPYCALKGVASAYYYPDPSLRDMGDVDFLVAEKDFERAKKAVLSAGFTVDHGDDPDSFHTCFKRPPLSIWEQHRSVNGVPGGEIGEKIKAEINRTIETSELITLDGAVCRIPDAFHHGLIMLLHTASHLTSEGIGLRHLCDWAVFADKLGSSEFRSLFEDKLKGFGLWRFAQILTMVSEKYLGASKKEWAQIPGFTDEQLEAVIVDILSGGNFGRRDMNRYREIKYISNRGERTVDSKNIVLQAFGTMNRKVYADYKFIEKHKLLTPLGWIAEGGKYIGLLISGKRSNKNTSVMLKEAAKRKEIYSNMELFKATPHT